MFAMCAKGDTYHLINKGSSSSPVEWADANNWSNITTTVVGDKYPGSSDSFRTAKYGFDGQKGYIALDDDYTVADFTESYNRLYLYKSSNAAGSTVSLTITGTIGGGQYQEYYPYAGAKLVFAVGSTLRGATSDAVTSVVTINNGGEMDVLGEVNKSRHIQWTVQAGGTLYFAPTAYAQTSDTGAINDKFTINGTATFPNGIAVTGGNASWANTFTQNTGSIVTFGGNFTSASSPWTYTWNGGTIAATADCVFGEKVSLVIPDSKHVTLDVSSGATFTVPASASIGSDVTLAKIGVGDVCLVSTTIPGALNVEVGGLAIGTAGTYDLSGVAFSPGTYCKLGVSGITFSAFDSSIANVAFAVTDGYTPASGATVLTCSDAAVLSQAKTGLNASLAGTGISVNISGDSLVAESHYTFNSDSVTDMNDTAGWVNGIAAPAGQPAIISGANTAAVMDGFVPAYSAISIEDGASLAVATTRDLPATTLEGGTTLNIIGGINYVGQSYDACIPNLSAVVVGEMDPSSSITELTDFAAKSAGTSFESGSNIAAVLAKTTTGGDFLVQFKRYNGTEWTKCVVVKFWQTSGTIYAQVVAARYTGGSHEDYDFVNDDGTFKYTSFDMADTDSSRGYSIKKLTFKAPVSGPAIVTAVGDFVTTDSGSATVVVAEDCILDLSGVDVTTETTLVKTGAGAIVFGDDLPTALDVEEGVLALQPYVEYDMSNVMLESGAKIKVVVDGTFKNGAAFVQPNGKTVYMSSGVYVGVGTWATTANWVNSEIPDVSTAVHVHGADTFLTIDNASVTMPASIAVEGGATLRVLADVTLPPLSIDSTSKVVFGDSDTTVSATLDASLTTVADATVSPVALPVIEIATNATLTVASGMKLKNIDFHLYGTVTKSSDDDDSPVFGYAANGETSYFAFTADGGVFDFHSNQSVNKGSVSIVCPTSGGKVVPVGTITLRNSNRTVKSWADFGNWQFGVHNPTSVPFDVLVDGTHLDTSAYFYASGAAHLTLVNGARIRRANGCVGHYFNQAVQDNATISVVGDAFFDFTAGSSANQAFLGIDSQSAVDTVTVRNGGIYNATYNSSGWGLGVFVSDGGILCVSKLYDNRARTDLLLGFGSARLDGDLAITSLDVGTGDTDWDRHTNMANVPFSGTGDVVITNGVPEYPFTVTMVSGANTATGSIKVAKVEGDAETALFFADGANWAGTVVAGNVSLTNLTDGAAAATATFGSLDLAADFNIRVWTENGVIVTNDMVNVGEYQSHGGRLSMEPMTEGLEFAAGDKIVVGKIAKASPNPAVKAGWCVKRLPIDGDDANELLVAKKGIGLQVILR